MVEYNFSEDPYPVEHTKNIIKIVDEDFEVAEFKDYKLEINSIMCIKEDLSKYEDPKVIYSTNNNDMKVIVSMNMQQ